MAGLGALLMLAIPATRSLVALLGVDDSVVELGGLFVCRLGGALLIAQPLFGTVVAVWCCLLADWGLEAALLFWRFAAGRWRDIEV